MLRKSMKRERSPEKCVNFYKKFSKAHSSKASSGSFTSVELSVELGALNSVSTLAWEVKSAEFPHEKSSLKRATQRRKRVMSTGRRQRDSAQEGRAV